MFGLKQRRKLLPQSQGDGAPSRPREELIEMGFLEHLEELRWRIIKGMLGIVVGVVACLFFYRWIIDVLLLGPADPHFFMYKVLQIPLKEFVLQNRTVTGQFFAAIGTVAVVGLILGSPIFIYQMWAFVEPGLYSHEKSRIRFVSVFASSFFMMGVAFGYLVLTPAAISFFAGFVLSETIANQFDITKYFGLVTMWTFGSGVIFELPVVIYFLSKLGLVTPRLLRKSRRYAIVGILVLSAFLTPPDPFTQIVMSLPLMMLYEGSILISKAAVRKRERDLASA